MQGAKLNSNVMKEAILLRDLLRKRGLKIVLAESCTAGRIAASLGAIPGISNFFCGSFVIYRNGSKTQWLGIPDEILSDPNVGPVSRQVSELLAESILDHTDEADVALAITGDIGPNAETGKDGHIYCGIQARGDRLVHSVEFQLKRPAPKDAEDVNGRIDRLDEAVESALRALIQFVSIDPTID